MWLDPDGVASEAAGRVHGMNGSFKTRSNAS